MSMANEERPKPPVAGVIYGEFAFWVVLTGMVVAIAGSALYLSGTGYVGKECIIENLMAGVDSSGIWDKCATTGVAMPHGHWYLGQLAYGDGIAMLGIAIGCLGGVLGMWGAFFGMVRSKGGVYTVLSLVTAIILTLSAAGLIKIH